MDEYRLFLIRLQQGKDASDSLQAYKQLLQSTEAALKARETELQAKDAANVLERERFTICEQQKGSLVAVIGSKDVIISTQENTIKRLGTTPKYWGFGIVAGYGYSLGAEVTRAPFIGVAVYRRLFQF